MFRISFPLSVVLADISIILNNLDHETARQSSLQFISRRSLVLCVLTGHVTVVVVVVVKYLFLLYFVLLIVIIRSSGDNGGQ